MIITAKKPIMKMLNIKITTKMMGITIITITTRMGIMIIRATIIKTVNMDMINSIIMEDKMSTMTMDKIMDNGTKIRSSTRMIIRIKTLKFKMIK